MFENECHLLEYKFKVIDVTPLGNKCDDDYLQNSDNYIVFTLNSYRHIVHPWGLLNKI